jgi:V/A-type H+-transporting ATPase subunit F
LVVLGDEDFVLGFRLAGVENCFTAEKEELARKLEEILKDKELKLVIMKEEDVDALPAHMKKGLEKMVVPVIARVSEREYAVDLRDLIKRSIGIDVWK